MEKFSKVIHSIQKYNLLINVDYKDFLQAQNLDSFASIWDNQDGKTIKDIKPRKVVRLCVPNSQNGTTLYIKKHKLQFIGLRGLMQKLRGSHWISQGPLEFKNICAFRENGLHTVIPVAAGERFYRLFWVQSLLITQDFSPYNSLELITEHDPDYFTGSVGKIRKNALLQEIASLAKKMHARGYHHRDFNATHILLHYDHGSAKPLLALFDLQRVEKKRSIAARWMIKGLARLNYSLPDHIFSTQDKLRVFLSYHEREKLDLVRRILWFWIQRKEARITRHTEKKLMKKNLLSIIFQIIV